MLIGYARTSSADQVAGLEAQIRDLQANGCEEIFREQVSSVAERPQLEEALRHVRKGDTLVVTKIDRLARNVRALWEIADGLHKRGIALRILQFGDGSVDTAGATGRLILNMFAAVSQFEREMMLERQREGIAKAKGEGKYKGRKPTAREHHAEAVRLYAETGNVSQVAKRLGIGRASVYRALEAEGVRT